MIIQTQVNQVQQRVQAGADAAMISSIVEQRRSLANSFPSSFDEESSYSDDSSDDGVVPQAPLSHNRSSSRRSSRRHTSHVHEPRQTPPASTSAIMGLTHIRVFAEDKANYKSDDRCCSVCSDRLVDGIVLTRLPCGHMYHISCIVPWLNKNCSCPECRYELPTADPKFESGRRERMKSRKISSCGCSCFGFHSCVFPGKSSS